MQNLVAPRSGARDLCVLVLGPFYGVFGFLRLYILLGVFFIVICLDYVFNVCVLTALDSRNSHEKAMRIAIHQLKCVPVHVKL